MSEADARRERIGWVGLGRIGAPMAERVRAAGWPLVLWARRPEAVAEAAWAGGEGPSGASGPVSSVGPVASVAPVAPVAPVEWADSAQALAERADIVCTIVTGSDDVGALHQAMMPRARPGTLFIDFTTAAPRVAAAAQRLAAAHGHQSLEAPVTGGVAGAMRGTLTGFVGGDAAALHRARPLLLAFANKLVHCGPAGSGYRFKLLNQTLMAGILLGLADGARLARAAGVPAEALLPALADGTARSMLLDSYLPRMLGGEGPVTFTLALLLKDLRLAREEATALQVSAPLLDAAIAAAAAAIERHGPDAGVQALAR
ncbi:MAG: NAD(P)-dependent oxidoreductase [Rubrivivax sp.]|nr:NAD(P)-dependent oxidoreductase [Rubrivivax sp.]